jgi:hypothetical protein
VNNSSNAAGVFSWDSLIWDGGVRYKQKEGTAVKINFLPWPANATLTPITSSSAVPKLRPTRLVAAFSAGQLATPA